MPEFISYNEGDPMIQVRSEGEVTLDQWQRSLERAAQFRDKFGVECLLVDVRRQWHSAGLKELFRFANMIPGDLRIAMLVDDLYREHRHGVEEKQRFLEEMARQAGKTVKSFLEESEAKDWLLSPEKQ